MIERSLSEIPLVGKRFLVQLGFVLRELKDAKNGLDASAHDNGVLLCFAFFLFYYVTSRKWWLYTSRGGFLNIFMVWMKADTSVRLLLKLGLSHLSLTNSFVKRPRCLVLVRYHTYPCFRGRYVLVHSD